MSVPPKFAILFVAALLAFVILFVTVSWRQSR